MYYSIFIINTDMEGEVLAVCKEADIPVALTLHGHGTATREMLDLLGLDVQEKRLVICLANEDKTTALVQQMRRQLYLGTPHRGIGIVIPVKSIGGGRTLAYIAQGQDTAPKAPRIDPDYELIIAVANEGHTDSIMDAARTAGAGGGTVMHAKGTGSKNPEKFFHVSIASEKEMVLIVAKKESKARIMQEIIQKAGPDSEAAAFVFSLPVSDVVGFAFHDA